MCLPRDFFYFFYFDWAVVRWVNGIVTSDNATSMTCRTRRLLAFEGRMARCRYELLLQHWVDVGARRIASDRRKQYKNSTNGRRLQNLCVARRDGSKSVAEALRGLGHTIRFVWVLKSTDVTWHRRNIRTFNVKYATCWGSFVNYGTYARYTRTSSLCTFFALLVCIVKCCLCRISDE